MEPTCVPLTSDHVPADTKRIQLKVQEKVADETEFPAVPPRKERRFLQSTGLARGILRRSCEGVAVDTSLSLNPLGESACGSMAAVHQHTLWVMYLFFLFCFFPPTAEQWNFACVNAKQEQADVFRRLSARSTVAFSCGRMPPCMQWQAIWVG